MHCMTSDGVGAQLRKGVIEYCVLAMLTTHERYGFQLVRTLGEHDGLLTREGTSYHLVSRLRKDGQVTTHWRESRDGPPRKYYAITPRGESSLAAFRTEWQRFRRAVDSLLENGGAQ